MTSESPENEDLAALLVNTMLLEEKLKCGETVGDIANDMYIELRSDLDGP